MQCERLQALKTWKQGSTNAYSAMLIATNTGQSGAGADLNMAVKTTAAKSRALLLFEVARDSAKPRRGSKSSMAAKGLDSPAEASE